MVEHLDPQTKGVLDATALVAVVGTIIGYLPAIAAAFGIIWYCCLITGWIANKGWKYRK